MNNKYTLFGFSIIISTIFSVSVLAQVRPINGIGANPEHPTWGSLNDPMIDLTDISFADGFGSPTGGNRANPRKVSNLIFCQVGSIPDKKNLSDYTFIWGQFIDHDITLVMDAEDERVNISVPRFDAWMDPYGSGTAIIPVPRSRFVESTGDSVGNPRLYANAITAYMDGSNVYGSTAERLTWLRQYVDGKLKVSKGNLLPYNTLTGEYEAPVDPNAPMMAHPITPPDGKWFVAGDIRANENVLLTSMHTTFVREHNRQCDIIKSKNPGWNDEQIFQRARKIVSGLIQSISYNEWLPLMIGRDFPEYTGFDENVNVQVTNAFSAAAFRYGHTTINSAVLRMDEHGHTMPGGDMVMANAFFHPAAIRESEGVECFLKGMCYQPQQDIDCKVIDDLRNMLFGPPGAGGMDLAAINIQRGRERGLADYNTMRLNYGLEPYTDFGQISKDPELIQNLYEIYDGDINEIDPWVGMLAETHISNSMFGELLEKIIVEQFERTRDGDPFFYIIDNELTDDEKLEISNTRLGDVVARTSGMNTIPQSIFEVETIRNETRSITAKDNNLENNEWGMTSSLLTSTTTNAFEDKMSVPSGNKRPNARVLSNDIFQQLGNHYDNLELSDYAFVWGQFLDHDISLVKDGTEPFVINVPKGDPWFDPNNTGSAIIPMFRSKHNLLTGTSPSNPRNWENECTAYIDGSNVYGSTQERADWLRTYEGGKLKMSEGRLLPYNTTNGEYNGTVDPTAPAMDHPVTPADGKWFIAGDVRANENPLLTIMHTLWVREHNRICEELAETYPRWNDETIYQEARRIVSAEIANITYNEWLPAIGLHLSEYKGYNTEVKAQASNLFSAAAFRFGHTLINSNLLRLTDDCVEHENGNINLKDAFFNPSALRDGTNGQIEPYFLGMMHQRAQGLDTKMIDDVRNTLFGPSGAGGMDLAAINIQRGRERGLPDYNTIRKDFGLQPKISFSSLTSNIELNQSLFNTYEGEINDIDPYVGLMAEDHLSGSLFGETMNLILKKQFEDLRDGDRFFFENDEGLSEDTKRDIRFTKLNTIIARNTEITDVPNNIFYFQGSCVTYVNDLALAENSAIVYPNPGHNNINLSFESDNNFNSKLTIHSTLGQKLISEEISIFEGNNDVNIDISNLPQGMFIINLSTKDGNLSKSFTKG